MLAEYETSLAPSLGRFEITPDPDHRHAFKTQTLRNVALTAPVMHDGSLPTLEAMLDVSGQRHLQAIPAARGAALRCVALRCVALRCEHSVKPRGPRP